MAYDKRARREAAKRGWQRRRERAAERLRYMRGCEAARRRAEQMRAEGVTEAQAVGEMVFIPDKGVTPGFVLFDAYRNA